METTIRKATADDAPALAAAFAEAYSEIAKRLPDLPDVSEGVAEDIADREVWVLSLIHI